MSETNTNFIPKIVARNVAELKPYANNARTHSAKQIKQIARSIENFGFTNPILISDDDEIIAGHGRIEAAKQLNIKTVPAIHLSHLTPEERRAYIIADNKLAENAGWDEEILAIELQALLDIDFDVELTGFAMAEIDGIMDVIIKENTADEIPEIQQGDAVTKQGDLWLLGNHRLLCGDAQISGDISKLVGSETIDLLFTDPPYNVPINGHVSGLGKHQHREFAFASGEMSEEAFTEFLLVTLRNAETVLHDGAIAFICMDWRHMGELLLVGKQLFHEMKNLCVWNKTNGGMGAFYRSKHELIFAFKKGTASHINNFGLGETGRYRTNVWDYAGVNSFSESRDDALAMHPTVKPVAMIADAIQDCTNRGGTVLDIFGGSGSTMIAAESCGRKTYMLEYDPLYCDVIIRRFEQQTGIKAIHAEINHVFKG